MWRNTLLVTIVVCATFPAQSEDDIRLKYGSPISETFAIHDGVGMTVRRGPNGRISEMLIAPIRGDSLVPSRSVTFPQELALRILDEVVPKRKRGKFIIGGFANIICLPQNDCAGSYDNYENVTISYNSAAEAGKLCYVNVRFKE
jgi:hypothetical protein